MKKRIDSLDAYSVSPLTKIELINLNGGGAISDAFWYFVGYYCGQAKRQADSPTGKMWP